MNEDTRSFSDKLWDKTGLSFWSDYGNLFKPYCFNWVNFRLIAVDFEWDKMDNSFNVELGFVGLNMRWQVSLPGTTKQKEELFGRLEEFKKTIAKKSLKSEVDAVFDNFSKHKDAVKKMVGKVKVEMMDGKEYEIPLKSKKAVKKASKKKAK